MNNETISVYIFKMIFHSRSYLYEVIFVFTRSRSNYMKLFVSLYEAAIIPKL